MHPSQMTHKFSLENAHVNVAFVYKKNVQDDYLHRLDFINNSLGRGLCHR